MNKFLVTTPIFYANSCPHIGHLYTMFYADAYSRWLKLNNYDVKLSTGTDEHGYKIHKIAKLSNMNP